MNWLLLKASYFNLLAVFNSPALFLVDFYLPKDKYTSKVYFTRCFMRSVLVACVGGLQLAVYQPTQPSTLAVINMYVRWVDADKTLTTKRHIHTYGHADKPGVDSLFWVYHTDFQGCSIVAYFSDGKMVKLVETARTNNFFTENSYYLQNGKLLFVKNRQVSCPILTQIAAWRRHALPSTKAANYFFRGAYYFAQDSCISRWEHGKSEWMPDYNIPGGGGRWVTVPKIFPLQAARYAAVFEQAPARKTSR